MTGTVSSPEFLARFACVGADCEDTCCQSWNMQVDGPTLERYRQTPGLMQAVIEQGGDFIMKRDARTDFCVKFDGGLCGIQKIYGEDLLSDACHLYPRITRMLGPQLTMTAALSCPEVARLALFEDDAFARSAVDAHRLPSGMQDYLPAGLTSQQALSLHHVFIEAAQEASVTPERAVMRLLPVANSLSKISTGSWPEAVPFYLHNADASLPVPEPKDTDPFFLLQALCGLVAAAKKTHQPRLIQTIDDMKAALHVTIPWDTLAIQPLPDCMRALQDMQTRWRGEWAGVYAPVLRRYLMAQLSIALFPFAGFGTTLPERAAIIAIRFATVKLALMSACMASPPPLAQSAVVRVIQSLSRFLDHLAEPEYSLRIYQETGWLKPARLRALTGDSAG